MSTQTLVPGSTEADLEAARLEREGKTVSQIAAKFDPMLSPGAVKAAIARGRHLLNQQAPKPTPMVRPGPQASPPAPEALTAPAAPDAVEQLLAWAETDGPSRAAGLAARTRNQLKELAELRDRQQASAQERELIATLEQQLADARRRLREMTGGNVPSPSATQAEERALIRVWARENGYQIGDVGIIAKSVIDAYRAARPDSGTD